MMLKLSAFVGLLPHYFSLPQFTIALLPVVISCNLVVATNTSVVAKDTLGKYVVEPTFHLILSAKLRTIAYCSLKCCVLLSESSTETHGKIAKNMKT
jgi:hypothetical protein